MPTDVPARTARRPVGRANLITAVESALDAGGIVMLTGPDGIGKTTVLDAVVAAASARGDRVLRISSAATERWLPYAGLADLLTQVPAGALAGLPGPQRLALDAVLQRSPDQGNGTGVELACRLALQAALAWCAERGPVLLALDDAHWLDAASAAVIGFATRRLIDHPVRMVLVQPRPPGHARSPYPTPVVEVPVGPLAAHELAELLEAYGLLCKTANRLYAESGGNPYLALALGGAFANRSVPAWRPAPLPDRVAAALREKLAILPVAVSQTLFLAALVNRPTVNLLRMADRGDAEYEVRLAASAGLVVVDGTVIRFTPGAVATVLTGAAGASQHAAAHRMLATVSPDPIERARHRALASARPNAEVARSLVEAAESARRRGAPGLVADLYLLAADRTPHDLHAQRLDWLVAAAEAATAAARAEVAAHAAEAVLAADAPPAHRVRARLVMIDLAGQAIGEMDEAFAVALADAGDDPALLAPVNLRLAWRAMLEGAPARAAAAAAEAVRLAEQAGDTTTAAMARASQAHLQRAAGRPEYAGTLATALAGPVPPLAGWLHLTPQYLSVRFAIFDDRLDAAHADLLRMLVIAERGGGEELVEVLRSLAEVAARAGRCRQALDFAARAAAVCEEAGISPGPSWYTMAVVELACGDLVRATGYATRGVRASEQECDGIYLRRNLHVAGQALLRSGQTRRAVDTLLRLRDLEAEQGTTDPSALRWHTDLAAGLVALGERAAAEETVATARKFAGDLSCAPGVLAGLDRAEALIRVEAGDLDAAAELARSAALVFGQLGQPIEQGHSLLVLGQVERRRRRLAPARAAVGAALEIFERTGAVPWREQAAAVAAQIEGGPVEAAATVEPTGPGGSLPRLTAAEARVASLVRQGASNREIAARIFVSVKTVEATLTRIYRKLGVQSRTQLTSRLSGG